MVYYPQFPTAIHHLGVRSIVLLTLSPLTLAGTCDLHVLAMPPAFNLSHDQTLQLNSFVPLHLADPWRYVKEVDHVANPKTIADLGVVGQRAVRPFRASPLRPSSGLGRRCYVAQSSRTCRGLTPTGTLHEFVHNPGCDPWIRPPTRSPCTGQAIGFGIPLRSGRVDDLGRAAHTARGTFSCGTQLFTCQGSAHGMSRHDTVGPCSQLPANRPRGACSPRWGGKHKPYTRLRSRAWGLNFCGRSA